MKRRTTLHDVVRTMPKGVDTTQYRTDARAAAIADLRTKVEWSRNMDKAMEMVNDVAFTYFEATDSFEVDIPFLQAYIKSCHLGSNIYLFI